MNLNTNKLAVVSIFLMTTVWAKMWTSRTMSPHNKQQQPVLMYATRAVSLTTEKWNQQREMCAYIECLHLGTQSEDKWLEGGFGEHKIKSCVVLSTVHQHQTHFMQQQTTIVRVLVILWHSQSATSLTIQHSHPWQYKYIRLSNQRMLPQYNITKTFSF